MNSVDCSLVEKRFNPARARRAQELLKTLVVLEDLYTDTGVVAGVDASYTRRQGEALGIGVAVVLDSRTLEPLDCRIYVERSCVPYIPGLLAYREMAYMAPPLQALMEEYDIGLVVVDGHGIAHPRRFGIASHLGVAFNTPSIGVAKKRLYGRVEEAGGRRLIVDDEGDLIGMIVGRVYVSPGNMVTVSTAARLVESMTRHGKLPEPTRVADTVSKEAKRRVKRLGLQECPTNARSTGLLDYI